MNLFQRGPVRLTSGQQASWKIECDALTPDDWDTLALMAVERFGQPGEVEGVPRGGLPFAHALRRYRCGSLGELWIVDDVLTTGASMERQRGGRDAFGVVVFSRAGSPPLWVGSLFTMGVG